MGPLYIWMLCKQQHLLPLIPDYTFRDVNTEIVLKERELAPIRMESNTIKIILLFRQMFEYGFFAALYKRLDVSKFSVLLL